MTIYPYPYPLPASVSKLRSVLQSAAADTANLIWRVGMFYSFEIYDKKKRLIYKSELVSDSVRLFKPAYFRSLRIARPFTCRLVFAFYNYSPNPVVWSHPVKVSVANRKVGKALILDRTTGMRALQKSSHTPRRIKTPRSRRAWVASTLRPSPESVTSSVKYMVITNGVLTTDTAETYESYFRSWTGVRTPHFKTLKRSQLPVNDHHSLSMRTLDLGCEVTHIDTNSGPPGPFDPDFVITIRSFTSQFGTSFAGGTPGVSTHLPLARNKAIKRLVDAMGSGTDANLAQDFVQFRQTAKTISDSVSKIASSLLALKKGNLVKATQYLWGSRSPKFKKDRPLKPGASLADNWLAMQYGWKPLLRDIDGTCRSLAEFVQSNPMVRSVRSSATDTEFVRVILTHPSTGIAVGDAFRRSVTTCKFKMRYRVASELTAFLAQTGFTNPVNLAWEVLPFSFVADWFLPLGPYFENMSNFDGLEFVDGCQTLFTRTNKMRSLFYSGTPQFPWYYEEYFGGWQREEVLLDRTALSSFPTLTFPQFKSPFDSHNQHILNGLALIRGLTK